MPRCHASHVSPCLRCLVSLCWLCWLSWLRNRHGNACLLTTTPQQPRLTTLLFVLLHAGYMYPRDHGDASTPTYADARRIYNIRSAPLHHLALSLPPASRSRPQYRVAAQSNTAAGRLHICCMLHSPPRDSGRTYGTTATKSRSPLRKQAIYESKHR
jgi:hypothetical protein